MAYRITARWGPDRRRSGPPHIWCFLSYLNSLQQFWRESRFGADSQRAQQTTARSAQGSRSFNDLVGAGENRLRYCQSERLGGFQVDDQLEFRRLLEWQVSWLGALEDLSGINAALAIDSREARSIADQAACRGELAPLIDRRNGMAYRQRHDLVAPAVEKCTGADDQRAGTRRQSSIVTLRPAVFDRHVLSLDVAGFAF